MATIEEMDDDITEHEELRRSIADLSTKIDALTAAINTVGTQQQYITDSVTQAREDLEGMLSGGGMGKMLGAMMSNLNPLGRKKEING